MSERLTANVAEQSGVPYVQVPREAMWEVVEYLSRRRTAVHYSFHGNGFTVRFPRLDQAAVQALLDEWVAMEPATAEPKYADWWVGSA